jgi:hypothetical protein
MDVTSLIVGVVGVAAGLVTIWVALPSTGTVSRDWLRSQAGVLYPLIPLVFLVFGVFFVLKSFGLA